MRLKNSTRIRLTFLRCFLAIALCCGTALPAQAPAVSRLQPILDYISSAWDTLTRSMNDCESVTDPKITTDAILYLPAEVAMPPAVQKLGENCHVRVQRLPQVIHRLGEIDMSKIQAHGLLYLPNKYVVPGGRFNEMYGWDSYFIARGLLRSQKYDLARGMVENFFYQIEHYGAMLNANRTYYLTRSQPPFLSSMFVDVYQAMPHEKPDMPFLERAYSDIEKEYERWTRAPHLAGDTGLSRYYDFGEGPPPEALKDESGFYRKVGQYFLLHSDEADRYILLSRVGIPPPAAGAPFSLQVCDVAPPSSGCGKVQQFWLSADYYKGDRAMRESGFDVSFRFGPFGAATPHFAPVCLNTLLYKTEKDLQQISRWLGRADDAKHWSERAEAREKLITQYFWNAAQGMFFDYDIALGKMSSYRYATTFYPLWAGLATPQQARAVAANLKVFEHAGGIAMSDRESGAQWDLPYGWGNIVMLAVEGLRRYGYNAEADRVSYEFLSMVAENFQRDGNIREKYNVVTRSSEAHAELGYPMNVVGFGWTNAAFLELLQALPQEAADRLDREQKQAPPSH